MKLCITVETDAGTRTINTREELADLYDFIRQYLAITAKRDPAGKRRTVIEMAIEAAEVFNGHPFTLKELVNVMEVRGWETKAHDMNSKTTCLRGTLHRHPEHFKFCGGKMWAVCPVKRGEE